MSNKDYGEVFLQSTEQIVDSKLSMVKFDQTIICTITDDSNAFNGEYQVSDGSVTFTAYSENRNYTKNSQVYVLIPQGNWANRKQITSLYSKNEDIIVRKRKKDELVIIAQQHVDFLQYDELTLVNFSGGAGLEKFNTQLANTLYITFKIQTNLPKNYPFQINIQAECLNEGSSSVKELPSFTSQEMLGNSSYYFTPVQQEIICPLDSTKKLLFVDQIGLTLKPSSDNPFENLSEDEFIKITDIWVYLCHDISSYENNTVLIFPIDFTDEYNQANQHDTPKMRLIWVNKDKYGRYIGFDGEFDEEKGKGIEVDNGIIINGYEPIDSTTGQNYYWIDWYHDTINKRLELEEHQQEREYFVHLLTEFTDTNVQAKVWKNGKSYDSNVFTFKNTAEGELIKDSLIRFNNGKAFNVDCSQSQAFPIQDDAGQLYDGYQVYPIFSEGANAGELIKFAPGQQISFIKKKIASNYTAPKIIYTTVRERLISDGEGNYTSVKDKKEYQENLFDNKAFKLDIIDDQNLRITFGLEIQQGNYSIESLKITDISSLCFTTNEDLSKSIQLLNENDLYNRLNAAEARIQQLEKQLSAYI